MNKPVILCVDDEKIILDSLEQQILTHFERKYLCELAESAEEALELIEELHKAGVEIPVVVSDQLMPGMKGDDFLVKVYQKWPDMYKILLTGQAGLDAVRNAINNAKLYRYIPKPWEADDLMLTLEEALNSYYQKKQIDVFAQSDRLLRTLNAAQQEISAQTDLYAVFQMLTNFAVEIIGAETSFLLLESERKVAAVACKDFQKQLGYMALIAEPHEELYESLRRKTLVSRPEVLSQAFESSQNAGALLVERSAPFEEIHSEILRMLATQAAISSDKAALYQRVVQKTVELEAEKETVRLINRELARKNEDILASIRYTERMQQSILPDRSVLTQRIPQSFVFYRPKDILSGDFYWWAEVDGKLVLAAIDCTGHGVPGALMSVNANNLLNQIVKQNRILEPEEILVRLHEGVRKVLKQEDPNAPSNDGMEIGLVVFESDDRTWRYAGAGIDWVRMREDELQIFKAGKLTVGDKNTPPESFRPPTYKGAAAPGEAYFLYSDGINDQFGGPRNKKFLQKRLLACLKDTQGLDFGQREAHLTRTLDEWQGNCEQTDDQLLVALYF
ncbi:MAG: SpoIIE family protein phosphatase [Bacteroidia bacterium]|nr:fused response regulator/phosphatase [Bacteroidia bacterium]MDW8332764.1 SpoIIE family protein phosphatase [Bacteroidia bacterium]